MTVTKKQTMFEKRRKLLAQEWRWFRQHGASLEAYIRQYGEVHDPNKYGNGGVAIFRADVTALRTKIERVTDSRVSFQDRLRIRWTLNADGVPVRT